MDGDFQARDQVLLQAQLADEKRMRDVLRAQNELDLAVDGHGQSRGDNVVLGVRIVRAVEPQEVADAVVHLLGVGGAEPVVRTRITEVPVKLLAPDLDLR